MVMKGFGLAAAAAFLMAVPAAAQIQTIDPNQSTDWYSQGPQPGDPVAPAPSGPDSGSPYQPEYPFDPNATGYPAAAGPDQPGAWQPDPYPPAASTGSSGDPYAPAASTASDNDPYAPASSDPWTPIGEQAEAPVATAEAGQAAETLPAGATVPREDVFTAAEGLFGRGAEGLAGLLENILRDQGEPTAYISGQEAGGALVFGVRYGSGIMHHQIEGDRAVYWTGPSVGFDIGADANKVFVLVYNLHDSEELFRRFPGAEGHAYFVGGFTAQYLRRGDVVLIPIRLGVGMRLGINAGYMRFSERNRWVPF